MIILKRKKRRKDEKKRKKKKKETKRKKKKKKKGKLQRLTAVKELFTRENQARVIRQKQHDLID